MTAAERPCVTADPAIFDDEADPWPAKSLCLRCLNQYACRWDAVHSDVAGVVGGLTEHEREQWRRAWGVSLRATDTSEFLEDEVAFRDQLGPGRRTSEHGLDIIRRRTAAGESASQISLALGLSERAVVRLRSRIGVHPTGATA